MHAVVKTVPGPGAVYEPWTFAARPGLRDIQVRVEATSICGTDMQIYDWHELMAKRVKPPLVMGHEFVPIIDLHVRSEEHTSNSSHTVISYAVFCLKKKKKKHIKKNQDNTR